jgi:2-hydroxychromene-2-carboxylate isomerase
MDFRLPEETFVLKGRQGHERQENQALKDSMRTVSWYFDFVSPFSYLCLHRFKELPQDVSIVYRPVLFAALLNHWGQKGPAEIPAKRRWTYRWCQWWAGELGVLFRFPALHPFNPLQHLRLCIAAGSEFESTKRIFEDIWTSGADPADPARFASLLNELNVQPGKLASAEVKDALRKNTDEAAAKGIFGVPSFELDGEVFWGADSIGFLKAFMKDPTLLSSAEMQRLDRLPVGAARTP